MDEFNNEPLANDDTKNGDENRSFLLDMNANTSGEEGTDFNLLEDKHLAYDNIDGASLQASEIEKSKYSLKEGVLGSLALSEDKIKYIDDETNLEFRKVDVDNINNDEPFSYIRKMGDYVRDVIDYNKYSKEVEKIGEDVARYVWAYKEGQMGDFDGKKFAKEVLKAGVRNLGGQNLHFAGNVFKMLGANIEEKSAVMGAATGGISLVLPETGKNFKLLGDMLDNVALKFENSDILQPSEDVFDENPSWINFANVVGQGAGSVLSMGVSSKVLGAKATYGLFAMGGAGDVFEESFEKDENIDKANLLASFSGGANFSIDRYFNPLPKQIEKGVKRTSSLIAKEILNAPLREAGSEAMQQIIAENLVRKVGVDDTQQLFEGLIENAIGGMAGSMFVAGGDGLVYVADRTYNEARKKIALKGVTNEELELYEKSMLELLKQSPKAFDKILGYNLKQNIAEIMSNTKGVKNKYETKKDLKGLPVIYDKMQERIFEATKNKEQSKAVARLYEANALFLKQIGADFSLMKLAEGYLPEVKKDNFLDFMQSQRAKTSNFLFVGVNSKDFDFEKLAEFEELEKEEVDKQVLWQRTGLVRGSDGAVRTILSDEDAKLKLWEDDEYEKYANIYQKELIHDLELLQAQLVYGLSLGKGKTYNTLYQDFYKYLKEHDNEFEKLELKNELDDPYIKAPNWDKIIDEGVALRREQEELLLGQLWTDYQNGVRDFNEEDGKVIEGIKEQKRFDEFLKKYWNTYRDMVMQNLGRDIREDPSDWVMSKEFVERMTSLASKYKKIRKERTNMLNKMGIVNKDRFYHDLDLEETYRIYLTQNKDMLLDRADRNYRPERYKSAYTPMTKGEMFLSQEQYDFIDETPRRVILAYLDNVERYYRLERYLNFAKEVDIQTNIKANRALMSKKNPNIVETKRLLVHNGKEFKLADILEHNRLYTAYPGIEKSIVSFTRLNDSQPYHFYFDKEKGYVFEIDAEQLDYSMLTDLLIKGAQFAIDHKEGYDYQLTDKQRKNFMDRHIYAAKSAMQQYAKDQLELFLVRESFLKKNGEIDFDKYWKKTKVPVFMLNLYRSDSVDKKYHKGYMEFGEIDFDKLRKDVYARFPRSDNEHQEYIHKQVTSDFYTFRERVERYTLAVARMSSGYRDIGQAWGGLVSQGKNDERALIKHKDSENYLLRDPYVGSSDGVIGDVDTFMGYHGDVMRKIRDEEVQYTLDKKAIDFVNKQAAKGAYDFMNNVIYLFNDADSETIVHETFHYFYDFLEKSGERDNIALDDFYSLLNEIKIDFAKKYKIENYNGKYYAMYKTGEGVIDKVPIGYDSKQELLDAVSKEVFVDRLIRIMNSKPLNSFNLGQGYKEDVEPRNRVYIDKAKMINSANIYVKWLKFVSKATDLQDNKIGEGGKKVKKTLIDTKKIK